MKEFLKNKVVTGLVVVATIILAGVAIFTALRLYDLRKEAVAPNVPGSEPFAWDCSKYTFSVSSSGLVSVRNDSSRDEPAQNARIYINDNLVDTLSVPALPRGQSANLGSVQVPDGGFTWKVEGTRDCQNSGSSTKACSLLTFTLTQETPTPTPTGEPSSTPTGTLTPTVTITPTSSLTPTGSPTITPTNPPGSTSTPTPTSQSTSTPTPTDSGDVSAISPTPGGSTLPDAGVGWFTTYIIVIAISITGLAILLAL